MAIRWCAKFLKSAVVIRKPPNDGKPLADHLLAPTRIYVKSVLKLIEKVDVHAIAHLTGGGFWGKHSARIAR